MNILITYISKACIFIVLSFHLRDNSVHLHECFPFWVGIFIIVKRKITMFTVWCRHAHTDCQSTKAFFICYRKVFYMFTWTYNYHCPRYLRKTQFQTFSTFCILYSIEIPKNKAENSCNLKNSKIRNCFLNN